MSQKSILETLFEDCSKELFINKYWLNDAVHYSGNLSRIPKVYNLDAFDNLSSLLSLDIPEAYYWWKTGKNDLNLERINPSVEYLENKSLQFRMLEDVIRPVSELMENLISELHSPINYRFCNGYYSPPNALTPLHFDPQDVFVIQIFGSKLWTLVENNSVVQPLDGYWGNLIENSNNLDKSLEGKLLSEAPAESVQYVLEPGSVLYIPKGMWHETKSIRESFSLSLSFNIMTKAEAYVRELKKALLDIPDWRTPAIGYTRNGFNNQRDILNDLVNDRLKISANLINNHLEHQEDHKKPTIESYYFPEKLHWSLINRT